MVDFTSPSSDTPLLDAARAGDERAFETVTSRYHVSLIRTAVRYVRDVATAEDVVQDTWIAFIESLDRFEGRCSMRTWLFRILLNKAKTRANGDRRYVQFSSVTPDGGETECLDGPSIRQRWGNEHAWTADPEQICLGRETMDIVKRAIEALPDRLANVIELRDVQGLSASEVCEALGVTETNQRVMLHRARSRVREALYAHCTVQA